MPAISEINKAKFFVSMLDISPRDKFSLASVDSQPKSASVAAGSLVSFVEGLSDQNKADVLNSTLLAQLAANKQFDRYTQASNWYKFYVNVLENVGWNVPSFTSKQYDSSQSNFTMADAVLDIMGAIVTGNELLIVQQALSGLKSLADSSGQVQLFNSNAANANNGNFQVFPVSQTGDGQVVMALAGLQFRASTSYSNFLWWSWSSKSVSIQQSAVKCVLNDDVYSQVRASIVTKLGDKAKTFIADLPI